MHNPILSPLTRNRVIGSLLALTVLMFILKGSESKPVAKERNPSDYHLRLGLSSFSSPEVKYSPNQVEQQSFKKPSEADDAQSIALDFRRANSELKKRFAGKELLSKQQELLYSYQLELTDRTTIPFLYEVYSDTGDKIVRAGIQICSSRLFTSGPGIALNELSKLDDSEFASSIKRAAASTLASVLQLSDLKGHLDDPIHGNVTREMLGDTVEYHSALMGVSAGDLRTLYDWTLSGLISKERFAHALGQAGTDSDFHSITQFALDSSRGFDNHEKSEIFRGAFSSWVSNDPEEAASYVSTANVSDALEPVAVKILVNKWQRTDPRSASEWVADQIDSPRYDIAAGELVRSMSGMSLEEAVPWALSIKDKGTRDSSLRDLFGRIKKDSPQSYGRLYEKLPDSAKASLGGN